MANHRFSEFHCNSLPKEADSVIASVNELKDGRTMQHVAEQKTRNGPIEVTSQEVRSDTQRPGGVVGAGPLQAGDKAIGEKIIRACRAALDP